MNKRLIPTLCLSVNTFSRSLALIAAAVVVTGCSLVSLQENTAGTLESIDDVRIRLQPDEPLKTDHQQVLEKYQAYLDVAGDAEMRVRVSHRMANLKLQSEELALDNGAVLVADGSDVAGTMSEQRVAMASIRDYEALLKAHPDRDDNDAMLYQLAKAYSIAGKPYLAIATLEQLTEEYPRSEYYLESEFRLGQMLYAAGDYEAAEEAYQRLIDFGADGNSYYVSARYLHGWSIFKQDRLQDSLLAFTALLDEEYPDADSLQQASGGSLNMLNDVVRIMAIMFDELGDWQQIAAFYDEHGQRHYEYLLYDRLASYYYEKNYYKSGASTLRAFVLRYPDSILAPTYYERLIDGYKTAGYANLVRKHKTLYIGMFGVGSEYWLRHNDAVQQRLRPSLSEYIWDLAGFWHAWGQGADNSKDKRERLLEAEKWYAEYIRSFPHADDTVKAHFLLAEVAFQLQDYPLAKDHYEIVAYQYPQYEKAAEAGYAAILSFNKYKPTAQEQDSWRQGTVASAMRFVQEFPQDERAGTVLVNTGEMLLKNGYYSQALRTSRLAVQYQDDLSPRYQYGAALVRGHSAFEAGYYAEAEQALLDAQSYKDISRKQRKDLREKVAASIYKQGEIAQQQGDLENAVYHWRRIADVIPESDTRIIAEYDSANILMQLKDYDQAIDVLQAFRQQYPEHKLSKDIPSKLIVAYEEKGEWRSAAFELQRIWKNGDDAEQQRIACFQSAEYFEKAGDTDNAIVMYKRYAHSYKRPFDAAIEAHYKLDQIYAAQGDEEKRRYWLDQIITLNNKAGKDQTDRSRYLAAGAAYELGEFERKKYEQIALTLPLDKSITAKNAVMQKALKRYTQSVKTGVQEYTTSSTYRIGELYRQLARGLMDSERPGGLDEVELEEYEFLLEDQAFPLQEAAIQVHQTNAGRTYDGLYDQWIRHSYESLGILMPGQYDKHEKAVSYVEQIR